MAKSSKTILGRVNDAATLIGKAASEAANQVGNMASEAANQAGNMASGAVNQFVETVTATSTANTVLESLKTPIDQEYQTRLLAAASDPNFKSDMDKLFTGKKVDPYDTSISYGDEGFMSAWDRALAKQNLQLLHLMYQKYPDPTRRDSLITLTKAKLEETAKLGRFDVFNQIHDYSKKTKTPEIEEYVNKLKGEAKRKIKSIRYFNDVLDFFEKDSAHIIREPIGFLYSALDNFDKDPNLLERALKAIKERRLDSNEEVKKILVKYYNQLKDPEQKLKMEEKTRDFLPNLKSYGLSALDIFKHNDVINIAEDTMAVLDAQIPNEINFDKSDDLELDKELLDSKTFEPLIMDTEIKKDKDIAKTKIIPKGLRSTQDFMDEAIRRGNVDLMKKLYDDTNGNINLDPKAMELLIKDTMKKEASETQKSLIKKAITDKELMDAVALQITAEQDIGSLVSKAIKDNDNEMLHLLITTSKDEIKLSYEDFIALKEKNLDLAKLIINNASSENIKIYQDQARGENNYALMSFISLNRSPKKEELTKQSMSVAVFEAKEDETRLISLVNKALKEENAQDLITVAMPQILSIKDKDIFNKVVGVILADKLLKKAEFIEDLDSEKLSQENKDKLVKLQAIDLAKKINASNVSSSRTVSNTLRRIANFLGKGDDFKKR